MDFELTAEQRQIRDLFARFVDAEVAPQAAAIDAAHAYPREPMRKLAELGFFAMRYPADAGGLGLDLSTFSLALTEIARGSMSLAGCAAMQALMGTKFLHLLGNDDSVRVPAIASRMRASPASVKRELALLKGRGMMAFEGPPRSGRYRITASKQR